MVVVALASTLALTACGGGDAKPTPTGVSKPSEAKVPLDEAKEPTQPDPQLDPQDEAPDKESAGEEGEPPDSAEPAENADAAGAEGADAESGAGAEGGDAEDGDAGDEAEEIPAAEGGEDPQAEGGADAAAGGGKDTASLIKEARTTKTTDERAVEALAEAEAAGATVKELARAAKARGDYLYKSPDRAQVFYEWSAAKDEEYPDPVFALAKQKAVTGEVEEVVKLLKQVAERKGGKKLLEQIDFDPTWDIVKEDPDVRALL